MKIPATDLIAMARVAARTRPYLDACPQCTDAAVHSPLRIDPDGTRTRCRYRCEEHTWVRWFTAPGRPAGDQVLVDLGTDQARWAPARKPYEPSPHYVPPPGRCNAGITPCGAPGRPFPGGHRCDEHLSGPLVAAPAPSLCERCRRPMSPGARAGGFTTHPGCDPGSQAHLATVDQLHIPEGPR